MNSDFDVTQLAAQFAQQNAEKFITTAATSLKGLTSHVRAKFGITYRKYIERILERYGKGKSFFIRSESVPLYDFFVPLDLTTQVRSLSAPTASELGVISPFAIITGSGGAGKSMMMRHLLVSCVVAKIKTPVFIELRQVNQTAENIRSTIMQALASFGLEVNDTFLESALESGQLLLLLDGFDEVEHSARKRIAAEIQQLAREYPNTWLFLSSRPDSALQGWDMFTDYKVAPLTLESATELVSKLPVDAPVKKAFIHDMQASLFAEHESFLSNPLLLSIMLLTYGDVAHIPHKLSTFYSQAYEALFHRHDALKSGFQRERKSELDIQDYSKAFAAFSLLSYDRREFSFTTARALELIAAARSTAMLKYNDESFLSDAIQAVCLLLEEGLEITFAHRSFQEYFVARFIQLSPPEIKAKLVNRFVVNVNRDAVIALLWELDAYIVEKEFLLPHLAEIRQLIGTRKKVGLAQLGKYLRTVYDTFGRSSNDQQIKATIAKDTLHAAGVFAQMKYRGGNMFSAEVDTHLEQRLTAAFEADYGDIEEISARKLKTNGLFVRTAAEIPGLWSLEYLQNLLDIEREIEAKHDNNRESIEQLLRGLS